MKTVLFPVLTAVLLVLTSCKPDEITPGSVDETMFNFTKEPVSGYTWYKKADAILDQGSTSGHSQPRLRTRYNAVAASMLAADGKVNSGSTFPEDAVILKELFDKSDNLEAYTLMWKKPGNAAADADGWVWGTYNANGTVLKSAGDKGSGCTGCHKSSGNIDRTLMNVDHP